MVEIERTAFGRNDKTSFGIIDSKSVKNADTAEQKGYDAGKKVSGIKIHITVDILGLPHAIHVTCANVTDRTGALEMISLNLDNLSAVENFLVDGGYSGKNFAGSVKDIHGATVEVVKKSDLPEFTVIPKRWIVERTFAWLEKNRRLFIIQPMAAGGAPLARSWSQILTDFCEKIYPEPNFLSLGFF